MLDGASKDNADEAAAFFAVSFKGCFKTHLSAKERKEARDSRRFSKPIWVYLGEKSNEEDRR